MENRCWLPGVGVGGGMNQRTAGGSVFVVMKQLRVLMVVAVTGIYTCVVLKFIGLCNNKKSILLMLIYKMEQTRKDLGLFFFFSDNRLIANKTSIDSGTTKTKLLKDYPLPCEQNPLISVNIYLQWQSRCRFIPRSMLSKYLQTWKCHPYVRDKISYLNNEEHFIRDWRRKCSRGRCDKFLKPVTPVHGINQMGRLLSIITHVQAYKEKLSLGLLPSLFILLHLFVLTFILSKRIKKY